MLWFIMGILLTGCVVYALSHFGFMLRFKHRLYKMGLKRTSRVLDFIVRILYACDIPASAQIGKNCILTHHGLGVVIHPRAKIGNNCKIFQHVTIGSRYGADPPEIGDRVYIGEKSSVLGRIKIGNNVKIGAHSLVLTDLPDNCVAVGIPAKIVKLNGKTIDKEIGEAVWQLLRDGELGEVRE